MPSPENLVVYVHKVVSIGKYLQMSYKGSFQILKKQKKNKKQNKTKGQPIIFIKIKQGNQMLGWDNIYFIALPPSLTQKNIEHKRKTFLISFICKSEASELNI